jgi:hypothetical protein
MRYVVLKATTVEKVVGQAMIRPSEARTRLSHLVMETRNADDLGPIDRSWKMGGDIDG